MVETYSEDEPLHKKHKYKLIVFGIFASLLVILLFTSLGNFSFTGSIINSGPDVNNSLLISADLTIPTLSFDGEFKEIKLEGGSDSFLYVGNQKFSLANSENNYIILTNYKGEISFDKKVISQLNGKATEVSVNGVPISSKSDGMIKIYFDTTFDYNILGLKEGAFIKKLEYSTSGSLRLDEKTTIDLNNDTLKIERFYGDVQIENNRFKIQGYLQGLDVKGEQQISVSV